MALGFIALVQATPTRAFLFDNLHGSAQLSGVQSDNADGKTKSLGQDYTVNWSRNFISYLGARGSLHYYDMGVDEIQGEHTWRREYQPEGELFWNHPQFTITGSLMHNKLTSNDSTTNLIRNNSAVSFATRAVNYPILKFRYEWNHSYNENNPTIRDTLAEEGSIGNARNTRYRLWQGLLNYSTKNQNFYYSLSRNRNENLINGLKIIDWQHQFRWNQTALTIGPRLRLNSLYSFIYRTQETTQPPSAAVLRPIPFLAALYAYDPTPELAQLDTLPALADGNTTIPVNPAIDLGRALVDRNIGVDFGFPRDVSALYIYTDRPSGSQLNWSVYVSADNLVWSQIGGAVVSNFNTSYSRYEITFPSQTARYVKVANYGANDVPSALVTEIEAWNLFTESSRETLRQASHLMDVGGTYILTKALVSSGEVFFQYEPKGEFTDSRNQLFYTLGLRYNPNYKVSHDIRYQGGTEKFKATEARNTNTSLTYNLKLTPVKALEFSFVALTRANYISRVKTQEANNLFFLTKANLLEALTVSGDAGYSRNNLFDVQSRYDIWTYHLTATGGVWRSLDVNFNFMYQAISSEAVGIISIRRQYRFGANYRMTEKIYFTGAVAANYEVKNIFLSQEYSLNWNLSDRISLGGSYSSNDNRNGVRYERKGAQINMRISSRTMLFANYSGSNATSIGGERVNFVQAGLNTGF